MIRGELLNERKCICEKCFREFPKIQLHVHHMTYKRFMHEEKSDLAVLCVNCHKEVHKIGKRDNPFFI